MSTFQEIKKASNRAPSNQISSYSPFPKQRLRFGVLSCLLIAFGLNIRIYRRGLLAWVPTARFLALKNRISLVAYLLRCLSADTLA